MKMVLGNPCAVEAQTLRVADLFGRQPVARLRGALIEQTGKNRGVLALCVLRVGLC